MRIQGIGNQNRIMHSSTNNHRNQIKNNKQYQNIKKDEVSFKAYGDVEFTVDFNDPKSLTAAAERLYRYDDSRCIQHVKKSCRMGNKQAEEILLSYVRQVRDKMDRLPREISELGIIITGETCDTVEQKRNVINNFFKLVDAEKRGVPTEIPNGILVYGNSKKGIDEVTEWIKNKGEMYVKKIDFDPQDPAKSISEIITEAGNSENSFKASGRRTILHVKNLDELLTNDDTLEGRMYISKFKSFIETASKNYHTTILMNTYKDLGDFEDASISSHRFNLKVKLDKRQATEAEIKKYNQAKADYKRIKAAAQAQWDDDFNRRRELTDHVFLFF